MRDFLLFFVGLLLGSLLAAFLTPKSGPELRGDLAQRYDLRMQELSQRVDQLQAQLKKTQAQLLKAQAQEDALAEGGGQGGAA